MYLEHIEILNTLNPISITVKILLSLLIGGIIGIEREQKQRPAGFRTYVIVCIGSTLAALTNLYLLDTMGTGDPGRIPAQVISGIGFLGAGTILVTRNNNVKGLTTAAGLWCVATIGIAIGTGFYSGAIVCAAVMIFSLRFLSFADSRLSSANKYVDYYIEYSDTMYIHQLMQYIRSQDYSIINLDVSSDPNSHIMFATFTLKLPDKSHRTTAYERLKNLDCLIFIEQL